MWPFEYLLTFESIILGMAVSDLANSLHRLLNAGARVKWDWLAPLAATMIFLKIVNMWWSRFDSGRVAGGLTFELYLGVLMSTVLLYLISSSALPDQVPSGPIDLRVHYASVSRRFWILFVMQGLLMSILTVWAKYRLVGLRLESFAALYLITPGALSLIFIRHRAWHAVCLLGLCVFYVAEFFGHALGS
jgi:hypothetical protein